MPDKNQSSEQKARDNIDKQLNLAGWSVQDKNSIDLNAGLGVAVREYQTEIGPVDYALFVDGKACGVVEAKKEEEAFRMTVHERQAGDYADSKLKYIAKSPLTFVYESTGIITVFADRRDSKPRFRQLFSFHKPETLLEWMNQDKALRSRFLDLPELHKEGLRDCQYRAITNLDVSFKENKPRALIQMATGSGKTYTAITAIYRLLRFSKAKRILFLVDTKNLGEQAEQEFMSFTPNDDNRKFAELYNVQRLSSSYVAPDSQVCISTIQRMYSILRGEELDESAETINPNEIKPIEIPRDVEYNPKVPPEFFDFIVIDECHRSIYNLWKQILDYFDAFLIGLTATPDSRTFGFFNENIVSEYSHEDAVADGVNVGYEVYLIETKVSQSGGFLPMNEYVDVREKLTRAKKWKQLDEDIEYSSRQLDKDIVNFSQIRNIIKTFRHKLSEIFPGRSEIPKTLIFAKTDSHAEDIIKIAREEFDEGNEFCKKITYQSEEDPKSILVSFRNEYNPRIAVTVDMIATGTDVKPLECLLFMRDVKSRNYFEQMKGRGTRTLGYDDLKKVTPSVITNKTHFIIVDAVGVTKSLKTDSRPLERKPKVSLKDLFYGVMMGLNEEDIFLSLGGRLARINKEMSETQREKFKELAKGTTLPDVIHNLLNAFNPDKIEDRAREKFKIPDSSPITEAQQKEIQNELIKRASTSLTGTLFNFIEDTRKANEQIIDTINIDETTFAGWDKDSANKNELLIESFREFIEQNKDEITALSIFYNQPSKLKEITYSMMKEVLDLIKTRKPALAPHNVWRAYENLDKVKKNTSPKNELTVLVSLIRNIVRVDRELVPFETTVNANFKNWIFKKNAGHKQFTEEQMSFLRMIRDHVITSMRFEAGDFEHIEQGMLGRAYKSFGKELYSTIDELNAELVG
ncbi:MAG TPA: restriction endonuclease subunit R [Lentisphaeria bacterium]|nr:MAG: restriction endonuclease subunit R [Lentisphaerae bacterium GWF2_38_69]HBM15979.1 restriction endonuclease subunit R [Lentisphaeria bacterium]